MLARGWCKPWVILQDITMQEIYPASRYLSVWIAEGVQDCCHFVGYGLFIYMRSMDENSTIFWPYSFQNAWSIPALCPSYQYPCLEDVTVWCYTLKICDHQVGQELMWQRQVSELNTDKHMDRQTSRHTDRQMLPKPLSPYPLSAVIKWTYCFCRPRRILIL